MTQSMRGTFLATMDDALEYDSRLALVLADVSAAQLDAAGARHPHRVINVGIREQLLVSVGGGLALAGMRPVLHTFPPFLVERPYEQLKLDLTHQGVGAALVSAGASYDMSYAGRTHQSPSDVALIDTLPGWTVHVPGHPDEARQLLLASLPGEDSVYLRLSEASNAQAVGSGTRLVRRGSRAVVLAVGPMLDRTLAAVRQMDVTVVYMPTVRPFDAVTLRQAVHATGVADVLLVEPYLSGTSAHVVQDALGGLDHRVGALGVRRDGELRVYGSMADHDAAHGLDEHGIAAVAERFLR